MKLAGPLCIAGILLFILFSPLTAPSINFWYGMMGTTALLTGIAFFLRNDWQKQFFFDKKTLALGLGSALLLWGVFALGNILASSLFSFSASQVSAVYGLKGTHDPLFLGLALLFWIGPFEEFFWRGYIQRTMEEKLGPMKAFYITTALYAGFHILSMNLMLFLAALICGLFWGYMYMRTKNLTAVIISHATWDVAIFVLFPVA